jgi:hypothetical protein
MRSLAWVLVAASAVACGGDPKNFTGMYSLSLTNGENGCAFANYTVGQTTTGVPITITQVEGDANLVVQVEGVAGLFVFAATGSTQFQGSVDGSNMEATIVGTTDIQDGACTYRVNATIDATLTGDTLTGTIRYLTPNNDPDCSSRENCRTVQNFNGTRPPSQPD